MCEHLLLTELAVKVSRAECGRQSFQREPRGGTSGGIKALVARFVIGQFERALPPLPNGRTLVVEISSEKSEQNRAKRSALDAWVKGVNARGGFGAWCWDVAFQPAQVQDIVHKHGN